MKCDRIFELIDEMAPKYVSILEDICNIESPTSCKEGVDRVGKYLIDLAKQRGWKVEVHEENISGNALCITMNPDAKKAPVAFSSHMDTVYPVGLFGYPPVRIEGDIMYGPGVTDCKGGIATALLAMDALEKFGFRDRPIKLILQSDEEVGSITSEKRTVEFMAECAKDAVAFLNGEPAGNYNTVTLERKGIIRFIIEITGKAAHSAVCYNGRSAVLEAAHKIIELEKFNDPEGITSNCGIIEGGNAANTVPEKCTLTVDFRYKTPEQYEIVKQTVDRVAKTSYIPGTTCTYRIKSERCSMPLCEKNESLFKKMQRIYDENGLGDLIASKSNGGSDAGDMTAHGVPSICSIGINGGSIHSINEFARISSIPKSAKRLAAIAYCIED